MDIVQNQSNSGEKKKSGILSNNLDASNKIFC